jgi:hypothetical protein
VIGRFAAGCAALCALVGTPAAAEVQAEYPNLVPIFLKSCVAGELSTAAREAAFTADTNWVSETPDVDVPKLGISRALDRNFDFTKPVSVKQWSRMIDGVKVRAILATFPAKRRYPALCGLVVPNVKAGWPYDDAFEQGVKAIGLKGKSTDLPHYFEYSGKVGAAKRPVRAELFGRTEAVSDKNAMHLYIAF